MTKGKVDYLLKWKGLSDNMWEPEGNLILLPSFYSHRKQYLRQINQREASSKLTLILKLRKKRANSRKRRVRTATDY